MYRFSFVLLLCVMTSCSGYLDVKPDQSMVVPKTLKDLRGLMDNSVLMNRSNSTLPVIGADNFFVNSETWQSLTRPHEKNAYVWNADIYESDDNIMDWKFAYQQIFNTNLVLERLDNIGKTEANSVEYNNIKGSAYFHRAWAFYQLAQLFCKAYDPNTAEEDLGLPLKIESDVNVQPRRSSVAKTYRQILDDLSKAVKLLPMNSELRTRPSIPAVYALTARVLLVTGDFENAYLYADSALTINDALQDFEALDIDEDFPFVESNDEVIFHATMLSSTILHPRNLQVDPSLYSLYDEDDLRKVSFFTIGVNGSPTFKGSYNGDRFLFAGLSTSELYLIKAECAARANRMEEAENLLLILLTSRYRNGKVVLTENDKRELLKTILRERRKELVFRGVRWTDLRRLNRYPEHATVLSRQVGSQVYKLEPNSDRYVLPIPDIVIELSGIKQNPR